MVSSEDNINQAIAAYNSQEHPSIRKAASAYGIPYTTLHGRLKGGTRATTAHASQQRLSPAQEDFLTTMILEEAAQGHPPTHQRVVVLAARILKMNGEHEPLGKKWIITFIRRNPRVAPVLGKKKKEVAPLSPILRGIDRFAEA